MTQTNIPRETDTALAEIYKRRAVAQHTIAKAIDQAHYAAGDRRHGRGQWGMSDVDAETIVRANATTFEPTPWTVHNPVAIVDRIDTARAELARCDADRQPLDARYNAAPWSRFFLVTSSDGHIHSSMHCQTCRPTTDFGWLPELSGQTEADAVAAHGPMLCTVCFPTAPLAWTAGRPKATHCTGTADPESAPRRVGMRTYRRCTCGATAIVNADGGLRKHKPEQ